MAADIGIFFQRDELPHFTMIASSAVKAENLRKRKI
jgi:hypothetical protein